MTRGIAWFALAAGLLFFGVALLLPPAVHVERSVEIQRPASTVFALLDSYRFFSAWSPWADRDPEATYEISGPQSGVGARLSWDGDPRLVGRGWQEITLSQPPTLIRTHLSLGPQGEADASFRIVPRMGGVRVTWTFDTNPSAGRGWLMGLLGRYSGPFFDTWVGRDYEKGLSRLKALAETLPETDFLGLEATLVDVTPADILYLPTAGLPGSADYSLAAAFGEIRRFMADKGIAPAGPPMAVTHLQGRYRLDAAIPVAGRPAGSEGSIRFGQTPAGRAVRVVYRGPYEAMGPRYEMLAAWMAVHGLSEGSESWEVYVSDPHDTAPEDLITHIYFLVGEEN